MRFRASLILALLLLAASFGWAQMPGLEAPDESESYEAPAAVEEAAPAPPAAATTNAETSGESAVEVAQFISAYLGDGGQLPDLVQVKTGSGKLRVLSAAEAFVLVARTVDLWRTNGELPSVVPIAPLNVRRPEVDPEDIPTGKVDTEAGREVSTEPFLEQAKAAVRWVDQLERVPTAVWVNGERLSAAEYLAGLAICLEYAYEEGGLLDTISLPAYGPPRTWTVNAPAASAAAEQDGSNGSDEAAAEGESQEAADEIGSQDGGWVEEPNEASPEAIPQEQQNGGDSQEITESVRPVQPVNARATMGGGKPKLVVFPAPGGTVSGVVELVASYTGPAAKFVMFAIDGATRAVMNIPPYGYRWDASALPPGQHTVRVQVLGEDNVVVADIVGAYTVTAPKPKPAGEEPSDEF